MIIYEVNLKVKRTVSSEFAQWLEEHIQEMLELPTFQDASWFTFSPDEASSEAEHDHSWVHWTVHYYVKGEEELHLYLTQYAQKMRQKGLEKFYDNFTANRRVLYDIEFLKQKK